MGCPFCDRVGDLPSLLFYENTELGWFAFLTTPPHTKGHTILAARTRANHCPREFDDHTLGGMGSALAAVVQALRHHYPGAKDVLFSSLRGNVRHFHVHLLLLWPDEEERWRSVTGYPDSHLMEFLGALEQRHDFLVLQRAVKEKKSEDAQRHEGSVGLAADIEALRRITGYHV